LCTTQLITLQISNLATKPVKPYKITKITTKTHYFPISKESKTENPTIKSPRK
jgi:hypothetical protein